MYLKIKQIIVKNMKNNLKLKFYSIVKHNEINLYKIAIINKINLKILTLLKIYVYKNVNEISFKINLI